MLKLRFKVTVYIYVHISSSDSLFPDNSQFIHIWLVLVGFASSINQTSKVKCCSELLRKFIQFDKHKLPLVVALNPNLFGPDEHWGPKA